MTDERKGASYTERDVQVWINEMESAVKAEKLIKDISMKDKKP